MVPFISFLSVCVQVLSPAKLLVSFSKLLGTRMLLLHLRLLASLVVLMALDTIPEIYQRRSV